MARRFYVFHAVITNQTVLPASVKFADARAVAFIRFGRLSQHAREPVEADAVAQMPLFPFAHRVVNRLIAIPREAQSNAGAHAADD